MEGGQIFEWFVDTTQKIESMYISNFKMVYLAIYINIKLHVVDYFVLYNFCM
jgi:hypothetical protein